MIMIEIIRQRWDLVVVEGVMGMRRKGYISLFLDIDEMDENEFISNYNQQNVWSSFSMKMVNDNFASG